MNANQSGAACPSTERTEAYSPQRGETTTHAQAHTHGQTGTHWLSLKAGHTLSYFLLLVSCTLLGKKGHRKRIEYEQKLGEER